MTLSIPATRTVLVKREMIMSMTAPYPPADTALAAARAAAAVSEEPLRLRALIGCAASGNEHCFEALYDALVPRLYALIGKVLNNRAHAEEVTQEVFLEIWQKAAQYSPERGTVLSWAATIAHRRAVDRVRSVASSAERDMKRGIAHFQESYDDVHEKAETAWNVREVQAALAGIAPEQAYLIMLAYFNGKSQREIAEETGIPLGTVKTRIRAGMQKLRERLEGSHEL